MLFGQELENSTRRRSGVVDKNVDAPKRGVSFLDKSLGIGRLGQISRYGDNFAVCIARNLGRRCFQLLLGDARRLRHRHARGPRQRLSPCRYRRSLR